jgi:uncharacterized membrane-anchored protein
VPESVAVSRVLDDTAVIAGDFRIDSSGHLRFAIFTRPDTGHRRLGRIVQRICEIETYKTMSMLGLPRAREISGHSGADRRAAVASGDRHDGRSVETRRNAGPAAGHRLRTGKTADRKRVPLRGDGGL